MSATHTVVVYLDNDYLTRLAAIRPVTTDDQADAYHARIECSDPIACPGWIECFGDHTGMDPEDEDSPAFDQWEDVEMHGVEHEWQSGYGWTIDYRGCPVADRDDWDVPDGIPMDRPGHYLVDVDWDDTYCHLTLIEEDVR